MPEEAKLQAVASVALGSEVIIGKKWVSITTNNRTEPA